MYAVNKPFLSAAIFILTANSTYAAFTCNQPVNSKKVVVFMDANASELESDGAAKAACKTGQRYVRFTGGIDEKLVSRYGSFNVKYASLSDRYYRCKDNDCRGKTRKEMDDFTQANRQIRSDFYNAQSRRNTSKALDEFFEKLNSEGVKITSFAASGHDGSGNIHGELGRIDKAKIQMYADRYPSVFENTEGVYLWGCYTSTPIEVKAWKRFLPSLKFLVGFKDSAPSNIRAQSRDLLDDAITKQAEIVAKKNAKDIEEALENLNSVKHTKAGIYAKCNCEAEFYFENQTFSKGKGEYGNKSYFSPFDSKFTCNDSYTPYSAYRNRFNSYESGNLDLPADTAHGEIRQIYSFSREFEHCNASHWRDPKFEPDRIALLLFFDGVRKNFDDVFHDLINASKDELAALTDVKSLFTEEELAELSKSSKELEAQTKAIEEAIKAEKKTYSENKKVNKLLEQKKDLEKKLKEAKINWRFYDLVDFALYDHLDEKKAKKAFKQKLDEWIKNNPVNKKIARDLNKYFIARLKIEQIKRPHDKKLSDLREQAYQAQDRRYQISAKTPESAISSALNAASLNGSVAEVGRRDLYYRINALSQVINHDAIRRSDNAKAKLQKTTELRDKLDRYLWQLDTKCMDFLDWHEHKEGHTPTPKC